MADEVTAETVLASAMSPASVSVDGMTVVGGNSAQQLAALQVSESNKNARKKRRGLAMARIIPGSAVGGGHSSY
jgi:hypothetical protein